jgi:chaperonin GroEL
MTHHILQSLNVESLQSIPTLENGDGTFDVGPFVPFGTPPAEKLQRGNEFLAHPAQVVIDRWPGLHPEQKKSQNAGGPIGGVAIIRVGAATETELREKKHRVEDALSATRAAVEEGIVPGGGVALINAMSALDKVEVDSDDAKIGVNIVRKALEFPMKMIAENAGKDGAVVLDNVRRAQKEKKNENVGYNVLSEDYVDMVKDGVIDPAKVTRGALENAASIAAMILTTEALITDLPEKERPAPPPMPEY